jgi:O-acetyl-ADP-ribose deacetylase (regulator of RNase III)
MLNFVTGNLFQSKAQTLVNTVNCVGVMGKGVALTFKKRYPKMFKDYRQKCEQGMIQPGVLTIYKNTHPWVLNFPTKRHWKSRSRLADIELGLRELVAKYDEWGIKSMAMPALGCGHGGLEWDDVRQLIEEYLSDVDMDIEVYEPDSEVAEPETPPEKSEPHYVTNLFGEPVEEPKVTSKLKQKRTGQS